MKLVTLNIWGGRVLQPLLELAKSKLGDNDIICLQEVYSSPRPAIGGVSQCTNNLEQLRTLLPDHQVVFAPSVRGIFPDQFDGDHVDYGNAVFVRKGLKIIDSTNVFTVKEEGGHFDLTVGDDHPRSMQVVTIGIEDGQELVVANYHGYWSNGPKTDDATRFAQSGKVNEILAEHATKPTILCGDFNLLPDTESFQMLAKGRNDLVTRYGLTSTRSKLYKRLDYAPFADYVLTSGGVVDRDFGALPDVVSDHLGLQLDFEITQDK